MSRNNTQALHSIRMMCRMQQVDEKVLYDRSRLILSIYRDVCWSTMGRAEEVYDDLICTCGTSLDGALIYLETFAPDEARERFEEKIRSLFETKWIIELVDNTMGRIREYPCRVFVKPKCEQKGPQKVSPISTRFQVVSNAFTKYQKLTV